MKRFLALLLLCGMISLPKVQARMEDGSGYLKDSTGIPEPERLEDRDQEGTQTCEAGASAVLRREDGIGALYLIFDREYDSVKLSDNQGNEAVAPVNGILHCLIDLTAYFDGAVQEVTVTFPKEVCLNELCAFAPGEIPDWVQRWDVLPDGGADLVLFSTHGDDEQLFFSGLLPWYGGERGYRVQVVYFTDHRNLNPHRVHEMLNGLWNVGIRYYPVFGPFEDYYTYDMADAYRYYESTGHPEEELLSFVVEQLRRYQPLVAVGHDVNGEYGHGMHKLYSDLLRKAVEISGDQNAYPKLAENFGSWDVPKTYLHLYPENAVTMDWDIPMEAFDGRTAYQISRDLGFPAHASQYDDFAWYYRGYDKAADVEKYSPCLYGLYRTMVGEDKQKNDFFENLQPKNTLATEQKAEDPMTNEDVPEANPTDFLQTHSAEKGWIAIPAVGTLVLTVLTAGLKENL